MDVHRRYASLALMLAYVETPTECQRVAATQGYKSLCIQEVSNAEEPAFALYASTTDGDMATNESKANKGSVWEREKEVVLVIRGTSSIHDVVTDIRAAPVAFPPSREEIMQAIYGSRSKSSPTATRHSNHETEVCIPSQIANTQVRLHKTSLSLDYSAKEWEWLPTQSTSSYSCGGIYRSALFVLSEIGSCLSVLAEEGFKIRVVGHSLGGAVAALVTYMLRSIDLENIHCFAYGVPPFVDDATADEMKTFVTSVVLHDDFIARVTPASIRSVQSAD